MPERPMPDSRNDAPTAESPVEEHMPQQTRSEADDHALSFEQFKAQVLEDFRLACESREASVLGRKEVLTGKAKFGIFGDGKEIPQLALARYFQPGDYKTGYYRDQTFMLATGVSTVQQFFAQLYADPDEGADPFSHGRQMNAHFASAFLDEQGRWLDLRERANVAADASPTGSQMPRSVGLALASKVYRNRIGAENGITEENNFSRSGNEVCVVTIGDASTSEGVFWESINAAGVQRIPLAVFVWDDGYGISVPIEYQTTKGSISEALAGMQAGEDGRGLDIYRVKAWDYAACCEVFEQGLQRCRETHIPALFHVQECTQPQGHSTSGSHERYKSKERLAWEQEYDGLTKMRAWMLEHGLAEEKELDSIAAEAKRSAKTAQKAALDALQNRVRDERDRALGALDRLAMESPQAETVRKLRESLGKLREPTRRDVISTLRRALHESIGEQGQARKDLRRMLNGFDAANDERYHSHLHSQSPANALAVDVVPADFGSEPALKNGFEVLNACFRANMERDPSIVAFGEDLGKIGDVNQGFAGLQEVFGEERVFDTGIREATIMGQGLGMAMRGLRPIAEIQYLDYLIYGLQPLTDDVATLQYRTKGQQKAPVIVRTRGHRLEGIWHTGSPIGMILGSLRGMHVCVPRNMVQAAGMYNTLLRSDEPALVIECLNGYRLKEKLPVNVGEFTVPLGQVEVLQEGEDLTLVTYGSCVRVAQEAMARLSAKDIAVELIDCQTLLPFDLDGRIAASLQKTNRLLILDEDVPGGASAYILREVLETQQGYQWLDAAPQTLTAHAHRSPYGSDGDYATKPSVEDVFETVYGMMSEADQQGYPGL